jgi:hypothetical protein
VLDCVDYCSWLPGKVLQESKKEGNKTSIFVCVCVCVWERESVCVSRPRNTTRDWRIFIPFVHGGGSHHGYYFVCGFSLDKWGSASAAAFYQLTSNFPIGSSLGTIRYMYIPQSTLVASTLIILFIYLFWQILKISQKNQKKILSHHLVKEMKESFENICGDVFFFL